MSVLDSLFLILILQCVIFFCTYCLSIEPENKNFIANDCFTVIVVHIINLKLQIK